MDIHKARCIVQSWLMSWEVPYEVAGDTLVVDGKTVSFGPGGDVEVSVDAVLSQSFERSIGEVRRLLAALGRDAPEAPRLPPSRRAAGDDLLARSMRLTAFAKTPNPPDEVMRVYAPIVKREADRAHRRCITLNRALLLEPGDYFAVGMVFLTIYLHRYQDLTHESRNRADLTLYLQQEFNHWDKVLHHDLPSLAVDPRGLLVEQFMQAPVPGSTLDWWGSWCDTRDEEHVREPSYTMPEFATPPAPEPAVHEEGHLPHHLLPELLTAKEFNAHIRRCPACSTDKAAAKAARARHAKAKETLAERLDGLDHDHLVEALSAVIENPYCDHEARSLASTLFRKHMGACIPCATAWTAWDEENRRRRKYMTKAERAEAAEAHVQSLGIGL